MKHSSRSPLDQYTVATDTGSVCSALTFFRQGSTVVQSVDTFPPALRMRFCRSFLFRFIILPHCLHRSVRKIGGETGDPQV